MHNIKRKIKFCIKIAVFGIIIVLGGVLGINQYVKRFSEKRIFSNNDMQNIDNADCIIVLGAAVRAGGKPSAMLNDRLLVGIDAYENCVSNRIIMSGDHGRKDYDEVNVMKQFAIDKNVPSEAVFMDHAGFSTYDSMYRAKAVFKAKKVIIISQKYHLYRAVYIAEKLGLDAIGISADLREYRGQEYRNLREIMARVKDFFKVIIKPEPEYLGEAIPVSGNGNATNDK